MKLNPYKCERCHSDNHQTEDIKPDKTWILTHINIPIPRPPPTTKVLEKIQVDIKVKTSEYHIPDTNPMQKHQQKL